MKGRITIGATCLLAFALGYGVVSLMAPVLAPQVQWVVVDTASAAAQPFAGLIGTGIKR